MQPHLHQHHAPTPPADVSSTTNATHNRLAGWAARHQAVAAAGGWRTLLREPIEKRNWDHRFEREVSVSLLFVRSLALQPGLQQELKTLGTASLGPLLDPARRRTIAAASHQQNQTLERYANAWASQQTWLIALQITDIRDIQAELATRMVAAGNWPAKELLQWKARLAKAQNELDASRMRAERDVSALRLSLQLAAQDLSVSGTRFLEPTLWSSPIPGLDLNAMLERATNALDKAPGAGGVPMDLWQSYQHVSSARDQSQSTDRALARGKEHVDLAAQILEEAVLNYNGMFMSTFDLLDHRVEKLHADIEWTALKAEAITRQSSLLRSALQSRLAEMEFGVQS